MLKPIDSVDAESDLAADQHRARELAGGKPAHDDRAAEPVRLFDRGVVYRDPETFGEYHLSYRSGDILSPKIESHEPLALELGDFVRSIREDDRMQFHTALARSVVRIVEAADRSLANGGREESLDPAGIGEQLTARRELAAV